MAKPSASVCQVVSGGEHKTKKVVLKGDRVHPSVERAVKIIKESFQKLCLEDQDILGKLSWYQNRSPENSGVHSMYGTK
jgi:predicted Rossmann fold nucleotide-binding protein DprA/Smf involved in DNA uptake